MRIPYRQYPAQVAPGFEEGILYRPMIPIIVISPTGEIGFEALVDTGSDQTIFPRADAARAGVVFDKRYASHVKGRLPGDSEELVSGKAIQLAMQLDNEVYRWSATVWFSDVGGVPILGHSGFLEYFEATFFGDEHELELKPVKGFPGVATDIWKS